MVLPLLSPKFVRKTDGLNSQKSMESNEAQQVSTNRKANFFIENRQNNVQY